MLLRKQSFYNNLFSLLNHLTQYVLKQKVRIWIFELLEYLEYSNFK